MADVFPGYSDLSSAETRGAGREVERGNRLLSSVHISYCCCSSPSTVHHTLHVLFLLRRVNEEFEANFKGNNSTFIFVLFRNLFDSVELVIQQE